MESERLGQVTTSRPSKQWDPDNSSEGVLEQKAIRIQFNRNNISRKTIIFQVSYSGRSTVTSVEASRGGVVGHRFVPPGDSGKELEHVPLSTAVEGVFPA